MNLILLGAPGAGKGSQAAPLKARLGVPHISTGDMLREARRSGTDLGRKAAEYMDSGRLVPDDVVVGLVEERLARPDASKGFILDGFPRTEAQADALMAMLERNGRTVDHVVQLDVPEDVLVARLSGRRSCPKCGRPYHVEFTPPKNDNLCDVCGVELVWREDDRPESVRQRLRTYEEQTAPLISYFRNKGLLRPLDGQGSVDVVLDRVRAVLGG
ncbi:MAG: adenylate kinase [Deltaproteobacteria bacterium]|nr:adenylate kinase [Deltaproteobacteria bacterium]